MSLHAYVCVCEGVCVCLRKGKHRQGSEGFVIGHLSFVACLFDTSAGKQLIS